MKEVEEEEVSQSGTAPEKAQLDQNDRLTTTAESSSLLNSSRGSSVDAVDALPANLRYSNFDLFCTLISIATYVFDLAMDVIVAVYFYHLAVGHGIYHYWYFGLTVTFILLPSLTMTGFSFRWYLMDADNEQLPKVPMWKWLVRLCLLMLQVNS